MLLALFFEELIGPGVRSVTHLINVYLQLFHGRYPARSLKLLEAFLHGWCETFKNH